MDIPHHFVIRESGSRIINPLEESQLDSLGRKLQLNPGAEILDLACGKGEMLCTWARDYGYTGTGIDLSRHFIADAQVRAAELGVSDHVRFQQADATGHVSKNPVDVASCLGSSWIGGGPSWQGRISGTLELLQRSLKPNGLLLIGEPYWRHEPPHQEALEACFANSVEDFPFLEPLLSHVDDLGYDLVEVCLATPESFDRYSGAQWLSVRRWLNAHPEDKHAEDFRKEMATTPRGHMLYQREHLGWGVLVLMKR